jgi:hypothetical protein
MDVAKVAMATVGINFSIHYAAAMLYNYVCVPHSVSDILQSLVATASPVCNGLLHVMYATQSNYASALTATMTALLSNSLRV